MPLRQTNLPNALIRVKRPRNAHQDMPTIVPCHSSPLYDLAPRQTRAREEPKPLRGVLFGSQPKDLPGGEAESSYSWKRVRGSKGRPQLTGSLSLGRRMRAVTSKSSFPSGQVNIHKTGTCFQKTGAQGMPLMTLVWTLLMVVR
jgi:hypothetical protein